MSKITVKTSQVKFPVAESLYGLFFEDINRSGDSGLYPEMLRNRSFEDSIPPEGTEADPDGSVFVNRGGWPDIFNHGEGMSQWAARWPETPIPAWYGKDAEMVLDHGDTLNKNRLVSLKVKFQAGGEIWNIGYAGISAKQGEPNNLMFFLKADRDVVLHVSLQNGSHKEYCGVNLQVEAGDYRRYDAVLTPCATDSDARLVISAGAPCTLRFGFTSLMPGDTYKGHGLRRDIVEMLKNTHSKFLRFPGGCIVEGFNLETAMRFSHTVGPVWERPTHQLMWHYRTTNGLGFHEYLQLCEDLDLEPMYVANCGLSCQGRAPEFFSEEETEVFLQECFDAIEYATGPVNSKWGALRAACGHPEPFPLKYIEIGNENWGPEYNWRYKKFYDALKAKYPDFIYISNTHTELDGLPTEVADEHYYNTPYFFAENAHKFDSYDRKGPKIFLGEYAVASGEHVTTHFAALGEAAFLTGVENNQDIVTLSAYAPLFQNADFTAWMPNLIVFDNHRVCGIPSYHMISLFARNRGKEVVSSQVESGTDYLPYCGIPGLISAKSGVQFKNALVNGEPVDISRVLQGDIEQSGEVFITKSGEMADYEFSKQDCPADRRWGELMKEFQHQRIHFPGREEMGRMTAVTFGEEAQQCMTFEVDVKLDSDNAVTLTLWNHLFIDPYAIDEPKALGWGIQSVRNRTWDLRDGKSSVQQRNFWRPKADPDARDVSLKYGEFNHLKVVTRPDGYDCYLNGELIHQAMLPTYPLIATVATTDEETVYLKVVNVSDALQDVEVALDCNVESDYVAEVIAAAPDARNSLDDPNNVSVRTSALTGAAQSFVYRAPASSVSVLKLKKA